MRRRQQQHPETVLSGYPMPDSQMTSAGTAALLVCLFILATSLVLKGEDTQEVPMSLNKLTPEEERIIVHKGTEPPFSGKFWRFGEDGTYLCKRCDAPLFRSEDKFESSCGWPSFDDAIRGAVKEQPDADGVRTEITCAACGAHLGHLFLGEGLTDRNIRHCVNSISLNLVPAKPIHTEATAYFAGGCFWGIEYFLQKATGVISTRAGYMGGESDNPGYEEVCRGTTGHAESVEVVFDPSQTSFEQLARLFFEIHDPTQVDRQGPDIGSQYRSAVFYTDEDQRKTALALVGILEETGYRVATKLRSAEKFWPAEEYHQDYYEKTGKLPYCHTPEDRF